MSEQRTLPDRLWAWLRQTGSHELAPQISVAAAQTAYGARTRIRIDHRIPEPGKGDARARWRITTREQFLPRAHFGREPREKINAASLERGRRIYCVDLASEQVMAALSYHLDDRAHFPLLLTALAFRCDAAGQPGLVEQSRALGWLLKQYVHAMAVKIGRGSHVDMDAPNRPDVIAELRVLGFRNAPRVEGLHPSGRHMRQDPP